MWMNGFSVLFLGILFYSPVSGKQLPTILFNSVICKFELFTNKNVFI